MKLVIDLVGKDKKKTSVCIRGKKKKGNVCFASTPGNRVVHFPLEFWLKRLVTLFRLTM